MNTNRKVGTLMLVEVNKQQLTIKNIVKVSNIPHLYVSGDIFGQLTPDIDGKVYLNNKASTVKARRDSIEKVYQPIIICDDEAKDGDEVKPNDYPGIWKYMKPPCPMPYWGGTPDSYKKVLVSSNQFSQEVLQAIVDGKVKDGDKVEVEMISQEFAPDGLQYYCNLCKKLELNCMCEEQVVKLRKDGTAIIHPYKESVEEACKSYLVSRYGDNKQSPDQLLKEFDAFKAGAEWQKNQK